MLHIVYGASASGKSAYAEKLAVSYKRGGRLLYIATMYPYKWNTNEMDPETKKRIMRHRDMRAEKGFDTVECYRHVGQISADREDVLLLECMSNLLANEMYLPEDGEILSDVSHMITQEIVQLSSRVKELIVVTNHIFSDADSTDYDDSTRKYIQNMAAINCALAACAKTVTEVVCGIEIKLKETP